MAMNAKTILCPTDFSPLSIEALDQAASLARKFGGRLIIVHVEKPPPFYDDLPDIEEQLRYRDELLACLHDVAVPEREIPFEHKLLVGDPAAAILRAAKDDNVDLIVMGTHGRGGFSRALLGSVADAVVRQAPCPVLLVKQPQAAEINLVECS
jgi:nucleotide-binding universal stress UspA family protein